MGPEKQLQTHENTSGLCEEKQETGAVLTDESNNKEENFDDAINANNQTKKSGLSERFWKGIALVFIGLFALSFLFDIDVSIRPRFGTAQQAANTTTGQDDKIIQSAVLPKEGLVLPVVWGDFGKQMIEKGVIDSSKFEALYARRGGLNKEAQSLLYGESNGAITITQENAGVLLNLFWALGLANKNPILTEGPMVKRIGDASRFASTGGWTLARGETMNHYSAYRFISLTPEQQRRVEKVSKNIYRPCCGNNVYFPDCNHGMAMLGLLELLASQNANEETMYAVALAANSYWFPSTYLTIAKYFASRGVAWKDIDPKEVLGSAYSSASGYQTIRKEVEPIQQQGGGGCGV